MSLNRHVSPRWYTSRSPMWISRPAGMCGVPDGETAVCQAGTSLTQPQSKVTVPPRLGSTTFSTPAPPSSLASSTIATTVAPVRLAMSTVSPRWSAWPWVSRITSGLTSSAEAAAFGLPVRKGSVSTVVPPAVSSKQDCPRKRMSTATSVVLLVLVEHVSEFVPDGDADQHRQPGLLGDQALHGVHALDRVLLARGLHHLGAVRRAEPVRGVERLLEDALERGGGGADHALGLLEALGIAQRPHGGLDLGLGVFAAPRHAGSIGLPCPPP